MGERLRSNTAGLLQQLSVVLHARRPDSQQREPENDGSEAPYHFREIALLTDEQLRLSRQDFVLHLQGGGIRPIEMTHRSFDPLYFVLLCPLGDDGWSSGLQYWPVGTTQQTAEQNNYNNSQLATARTQQVSPARFYAWRLFWRNGARHRGSRRLLMGGRLTQEYACTALARCEDFRLRWHESNQSTLRVETLSALRAEQQLAQAAGRDMQRVGRQVILGQSFVGGPRDMSTRYQDAIAIVRELGRPSMFVTMTCNPRWPEIVNALPGNGRAEDHPVIVARVFKLKLKELMQDLLERHVLGKVVAIISVIEFQYRGLPHVHILLILSAEDSHMNVDVIDEVCCAEIPPDDGSPERAELRTKILAHMIHNDCEANPRACMCCERAGRCRWGFPKPHAPATTWTEGELYPRLRRRAPAPGDLPIMQGNRRLDNRWVATYNAWLLNKYDCHLNVEVCASIEAVKYLYKCDARSQTIVGNTELCMQPCSYPAALCYWREAYDGVCMHHCCLRTYMQPSMYGMHAERVKINLINALLQVRLQRAGPRYAIGTPSQ